MQILFSSVHNALGVTGALDYQTVLQAIQEGVPEDEHLDWKRELPSDGDEVAKDAAALANSRGGLLIYGVAEDRKTGRASAPMPVGLDESEQRRIRAWLGTRVNPMIAGVEFVTLRSSASDTEGFLVVSVPESPSAPHMIGKDSSLGFPYRVGAQTFWMREWDLDRAYRERFARQASDEARLIELINHLTDQLDVEKGCWLAGVARPSIGVPATAPVPDRHMTVRTIEQAIQLGTDIAPLSDRRAEVIRALDNNALNPRVGLRRWVAATRATHTPDSLSDQVYLELHRDGSVVLATRVDGQYRESIEGKHCVPDFMVTGFAIDFVALFETAARSTGSTGQTMVRIDLLRSDDSPFAFLALERTGFGQPSWTRDVRRFVPVLTVAPRTTGIEQMRDIARAIAADIVTQFGYSEQDLRW